MKKVNELSYKDLKDVCSPDIFKFETTDELDAKDIIYGQDRGLKALEFGLSVDVKGYNLFLEGPSGVGKTMYTKHYLETIAKKEKVPDDWCYIYNFDDPNEPIAVNLPAGDGKVFKDLMDDFTKDITNDIKRTFNNEDFEKEKGLIRQEFEQKRTMLLEALNNKTMEHGFQVKASENGIYMMPVINGNAINEEEFEKLDAEVKKEFEDKSNIVQEQILNSITEIKAIEKAADKKIDEWQSNVALLTINVHITTMKNKYKKNKKIVKFLEAIKKDILRNIPLFLAEDKGNQTGLQPGQKIEQIKPWVNYRVNLFVDNSNLEGAPVIMDSNYAYNNIFGRLEYENQFGALKTDYTMIKPGLLHKANGGYILLQAKDLISNPVCYEALKKALTVKQVAVENTIDQRSSMVLISLKPESIPLNVKVLLVGDESLYYTLLSCDADFRKLFKIKVEFEEKAPKNNENILKLVKFVRSFCEKEDLLPLDRGAAAKVVEFSSRLADDRTKLSTKFSEIGEIVGEASTWARLAKQKVITKEYMRKSFR